MKHRVLSFAVTILVTLVAFPAVAQDDVAKALARARAEAAQQSFEAAIQTLRDALAAHPDNPEILLELGRTAYGQAMEVFRSSSPTLGQLALLDAMKWLRQAIAIRPEWPEALKLLGAAAVQGGDYKTAVDAYRRAADLDPADGESRYQLGYSLAYLGRYEEAVRAFDKAETVLGPDPRILLNRGISQLRMSRTADAELSFIRLIRGEIAAKRRGSAMMRDGFTWLWKMHSEAGTFEAAEGAFLRVTKEFPDLASGWWYLAHARLRLGRPADAAAAFSKLTRLQPDWPDGWRSLGDALLSAGQPDDAVAALDKYMALAPGSSGAVEFLLATVNGFADKSRPKDALALLDRYEADFTGDPVVLERRGDLLVRLGRLEDAVGAYRAAAAADPFGVGIRVKEQKAISALLLAGEAPEGLKPLRPTREPAPAGPGGKIFDFEGSGVYVRVNGAATGMRTRGGFELKRTKPQGEMANVSLTFIPTIDTRPFTAIRFDVRGPKGTALILRAKDGYDQFEMTDGYLRLLEPQPVELSGEAQTVTLPLDGFRTSGGNRQIPMNRARLRALAFEIGSNVMEGTKLAPEIWIDNVVLVPDKGPVRPIENFDAPPREDLFLTGGAATAFARTLFTPDQLATFYPDPNTYVTPGIFGDQYDPADVHGGEGSFRLTVTQPGDSFGELTFNPDRSYDQARTITFWAKGRAGGERLRVTFTDALDADVKTTSPASAPRLETAAHLLAGWFTLSPEWKQYRIPCDAFPDVDFRSLVRIAFEFGTPEGNGIGTTIWLDDIAWE